MSYTDDLKRISKKFEGIERKMDTRMRDHSDIIVDPENQNTQYKVREMISGKMNNFLVKESGYDGKYAAAKYMGKPISELMREERKTENLLKDAEEKLDALLNKHYESAYKTALRVAGATEESAKQYAMNYVKKNVINTYAKEDEDPKAFEAHKQYLEMDADLARRRVDHNAVLVAKEAYINENEDLIREMREKKRREDLEKSGLLKELGLVDEKENTEEVKEDGSAI